ncbi:MAG: Fe-S-containing protein [Treponema sp.]|nr:Fe-S-containing protein [Treponema sp.]
MLKYLIQVVQNALPGAIPVSLIWAVLYDRVGETGKRRFGLDFDILSLSAILGIVAALILTVLRSLTRLINREYVNTAVLSLAILSAVLFILFLPGGLKKKPFHEKILAGIGAVLAALILFYTLPTVFLYVREFVPPGESAFSTDVLFKLTGYLAGLLVVILAGAALFKTAQNLHSRLTGLILSAVLAVTVVNHLSVIVQFLLARRIIRTPRWLFRIIIAVINHNVVFLYILMGLSLVIPLVLFVWSRRIAESWRNPAEHRKLRALKRSQRRWSAAVVLLNLAALSTLTVVKTYSEQAVALSPAEPMTIQGDEIIIPIDKINDRHLHRYNYTASENIEMRFIIIRKNDAAYGVGLDACDICGPTGYYERKDGVVCRLCDVVMNTSTIGFKGGCNPVPLAYTMRGGNMVIQTRDLEAERLRFK